MLVQSVAKSGTGPVRFEALDAGRGICALLIAFLHAPLDHPLKAEPGLLNLQFCVDFFFVLSGFVLLHSYGGRLATPRQAGAFLLARFGRLWPLHVVMLALFVAMESTRLVYSAQESSAGMLSAPFGAGHRLTEVATSLLFLQSFGIHGELSWNYPSWSIAVEFYGAAVLAAVVLIFGPRRGWVFAAAALAAGLALYHFSPETLFAVEDWGFLRCLFDMFVGCAVYVISARMPAPMGGATGLEAAMLAAAVAFVVLVPEGALAYAAPLLFGAVILVFSFERGALSRAARASIPQSLGRWSYSIYMLHAFVFQLFRSAMHVLEHRTGVPFVVMHGEDQLVTFGSGWLNFAVAVLLIAGVVVPLAAVSYARIEQPGIAFFRALARPRWRPDVATAAA